jgi:hypothetical protein
MRWIATWRERFRALFFRTRQETEMDEELRFHLEQETELLREAGLEPHEARRQAQIRFGGVERFKEEVREARGIRVLEDLAKDVRYGTRMLRKRPGFTAITILTLALGIGANTAIFSVVSGVLFRPLPYAESEELFAVWSRYLPVSGFEFDQFSLSMPEYVDYRDQNETMEDVALWGTSDVNVTDGEGEPEELRLARTTPNLFALLRASHEIGRTLVEGDGGPASASVAVLSHGLWQRRFGGNEDILGRTLSVSGYEVEVVGVMSDGFGLPNENIQIWTALSIDEANLGDRTGHQYSGLARLALRQTA